MQWEEEQLMLQGGLQGRFAEAFCVAQTGVDALQRYLAGILMPEELQKAERILADVEKSMAKAERLSLHAAQLATGCTANSGEFAPLELGQHLSAFCRCANEELVGRGFVPRISFADETQNNCWCRADSGLVDGIFVNLLSNSLHLPEVQKIFLRCGSDGRLSYRDDGPGLADPYCRRALEEGVVSGPLESRGGLGLLLAHTYAVQLGWKPVVGGQAEFLFVLPGFDARTAFAALNAPRGEERQAQQELRVRIGRELDGVFGPKNKK